MLRKALFNFTRRSKRDYVPQIYKRPQFNPSQKKAHPKVQPHPELLKMREEFYAELNKHEVMAQRNAIFENIREQFRLLQGHWLAPSGFEEAIARLDDPADRRSIQLNIEECLRRTALVSDIKTVGYYLQKAAQFDIQPKVETFELILKGLIRFAVHYNYHQKGSFDDENEENVFADSLKIVVEIYAKHFSDNSALTAKLEVLLNNAHKCASDTKSGVRSLINFAHFLATFERYNVLKKQKVFDVQANFEKLTTEERKSLAKSQRSKMKNLSWLFEKYPLPAA